MRVGIVGAGLAGLTAAFYLRRNDPTCQLHLFEAGNRCGGVIRTERVGEFLLEHGADMFATQPDAALRLCEDLGIADRLISPQRAARGAGIVHQRRVIKIPDGFVLMRPTRIASMLTTPLLSPLGKLRLLAEGMIPTRTELDDESIESFVTRRLGREVLQRIVQPLVGGIYTGDVAKLSMAATMSQFLQMEREDGSLWAATRRRRRQGIDSTERNSAGARYEQFRSFPGGIQELIDALASTLDRQSLHFQQPISAVKRVGNRWHVEGTSGQTELLDHLILATPARVSAALLRRSVPQVSEVLGSIEAASSAIVALGVRACDIAKPIDVAGFVVPACEQRRILAASFTSDKFAGRAPENHKLIRVFFGGALQQAILQHNDDHLIAIARQELGELIGLSGEPTLSRVIRWNEAMPQYHIGHLHRLAVMDRELQTTSGLHIIGNSLRGVGIAQTVAAAAVAARAIVEVPDK
jgi:protoporphyrinogen/coproporphyrinogen III oxidase